MRLTSLYSDLWMQAFISLRMLMPATWEQGIWFGSFCNASHEICLLWNDWCITGVVWCNFGHKQVCSALRIQLYVMHSFVYFPTSKVFLKRKAASEGCIVSGKWLVGEIHPYGGGNLKGKNSQQGEDKAPLPTFAFWLHPLVAAFQKSHIHKHVYYLTHPQFFKFALSAIVLVGEIKRGINV